MNEFRSCRRLKLAHCGASTRIGWFAVQASSPMERVVRGDLSSSIQPAMPPTPVGRILRPLHLPRFASKRHRVGEPSWPFVKRSSLQRFPTPTRLWIDCTWNSASTPAMMAFQTITETWHACSQGQGGLANSTASMRAAGTRPADVLPAIADGVSTRRRSLDSTSHINHPTTAVNRRREIRVQFDTLSVRFSRK
jgi:hypothetical protein